MTDADDKRTPICNGCGADIIGIGPGATPWALTVRDPLGREIDGGIFCLPCIIELAKRGLQLHAVRR